MRDWNLRKCARRGHATYTPTGDGIEAQLRERLRTDTVQGEAWRCLRCGAFVLGPARHSGPADEAPEVLRGKALRDHFILRVLAVERVVRGVVIFLISYAVWKFANNQNAIHDLFENDITIFQPVAKHWGYDLDHATVVNRIRTFFTYSRKSVHVASLALAGYALLETVEGIGLWLAKRWGEYLTAVGTSIFLPLEIWDGYSKFDEGKSVVLACTTFTINVLAVVYLLLSKRLFGIRGGGPAFEAKKHAESLLTVELAACGHVPPTRAEEKAAEHAADEAARAVQVAEPKAKAGAKSEVKTEPALVAESEESSAESPA